MSFAPGGAYTMLSPANPHNLNPRLTAAARPTDGTLHRSSSDTLLQYFDAVADA